MKINNVKFRILVSIAALVIAALFLMSNTRAAPPVTDLSTLDTGDPLAYYWEAMGEFYRDQAAASTTPSANDLNSLEAGDPLAYYWEAMGTFYRDQATP